MANVTLENITALLHDELEPLKTDIAEIKRIQKTHTAALEQLLTDKKKRDENKEVGDSRLDYLERWAKQASKKLGIEFKR